MSEGKSFPQRWEEYRPTKALWLWSCAGCAVATMLIGFTVGGWVTGGTANEMVENASDDARAGLVASLCVDKFLATANAADRLAELKEVSSWKRDDVIKDGGFTKIAGLEDEISGAADMCADRLAALDEVPAQVVAPDESTVKTTTSDG
ncbi:hypothetical protein L598_000400000300 [Mesorhizobium sp. J18]|uniref:hypothetical protein n=1 Tax=Mesorhizobium sp. J18 TaxID=935263 RepID=UPI00119BF2E1|nr:hypothetical protein [Mesorhizobium sp. J18]TWG93757.1 hypothetical protein L598_000400000300 [Mesorhizobium sp. J18]